MKEQLRSLDFQLIERASEKYENIREAVIVMEIDEKIETFTVEIYKHFSPVQIKMCVQELIEKIDLVRSHDKKGFGNIIVPYMMFLIVKHFTTLELPNVFAHQLKAIEHMTNTGTLFQIFSYMDENEINKIKDEAGFIVDNFDDKMEGAKEMKEKIKSLLVDKSLLE